MEVLPYAGLHGVRECVATTDDSSRPAKQPRTDGPHAYPAERSAPKAAGTATRQNEPVVDLTALLAATEYTTMETICKLLDSGPRTNKKSHHKEKKVDEADPDMMHVDMTEGTDGGTGIPPPVSSEDLQPVYLASLRPDASCEDCGRVFTVEDTVFRQIGATFTTCCDTCHQKRFSAAQHVAGKCILAYTRTGITCVDAPITIRPHKCHNCGAIVAPDAELKPAKVRAKVMHLLPFYREEVVTLQTTECDCGQSVAMPLERLSNKGLAFVSGNLHSQYPLYVDVDDAMKTLWFVGVVDMAHLHEQRMHTTPAMKAWLEALVETSWQFGYTSAKVPPDARISDLMMAMLAFGQQKYALRAASMPEKVAPCILCTKISVMGADGQVTETGGGCRGQLFDGGSFSQTKKSCKEEQHVFRKAITDAPQILVPHEDVNASIERSANFDPRTVQPAHTTAPAADLSRAEGCTGVQGTHAKEGQGDVANDVDREETEPGCSREDRNMRADNKPDLSRAHNGNKITMVSLCVHLFVFGMISYWGSECHAVVDALLIYMLNQGKLHPRSVNSDLWSEMKNVPYMVLFYDLACRAGLNFPKRYKHLTGKDLPFFPNTHTHTHPAHTHTSH